MRVTHLPATDSAAWTALEAELDAWAASGRIATLWWRDDDATAPSAALDRLLTTAADLPLALAVIPGPVDPGLSRYLQGRWVTVLQHGIAHENRAPIGARSSEFPPGEPVGARLAALDLARRRMADLFGDRFLPVLVPPWNRISTDLAARLGEAGFIGLSAAGGVEKAGGVQRIDIQIDPVDWRGNRSFAGVGLAVGRLVDHLRSRRAGRVADIHTGILTHHRLEDPLTDAFMAELVALVQRHKAAAWCATPVMFRP